jgi:hypothetical protein
MGDQMIRKFLTTSLLLLAALTGARADYVDLDDPVVGHSGKTWADVVRAIVPDLDADGAGNTVIDLPYLVDLGDGDPPPQPQLPVSVSSIEVSPIKAEGRSFTTMLVDLGGAEGWAVNVVALALLDEDLKLLDVINVGQDKLNAFRPPLLQISDKDEALLTYSEHGNSNQVYGAYGLIMVRDGKFQVIDTYSTLDDHWCGHERKQALTFDIPPAGAGYWPIIATITDRQAEPDPAEDCGDEVPQPGFENTYSVTYNWSASMGLYVADGEGLAPLYELNESRY